MYAGNVASKSMTNIDPSSFLQTTPVSSRRADHLFHCDCPYTVAVCIIFYTALLVAAWFQLSHPSLKLTLLCVALPATQKTLWKPIWAARAPGLRHICRNTIWIRFQTTSTGGLDPVRKNFGVFFCCPDFLKSIWIQSGYAQKMYSGWQSEKSLRYRTTLLPWFN